MPLNLLVDQIAASVQDLKEPLSAPEVRLRLGLRRAARLPVTAAVYQELKRPILLLTDRADQALTILDELGLWLPNAPLLFFPEPNPLFYEDAAWGENTRRSRLVALTMLAAYHIPGMPIPKMGAAGPAPIIIAPVRAVLARTIPRRDFLAASRTLKSGQVVKPDELIRTWVAIGYEPVNTVIASGQFARRGGILDVWPPAEPLPVRVEFFGDEIDTLRQFDPASQRTTRPIDRLLYTPAREYIAPLDDAHQPPADGWREFHIPLLHRAPASLIDYLPRQSLILLDNAQALLDAANEIEEQAVSLRRDYIKEGTLPADFPIPYNTWTEVEDAAEAHTLVELGPVSPPDESYLELADRFSAGPRFGGRLKFLLDYLTEALTHREPVVIVSRQAARLTELWTELPLSPEQRQILSDRSLAPEFIEGSLAEGWVFKPQTGAPLHLLTDGEIFGWRRPEPRRRLARQVTEAPESAYADLQPEDWVVHVDHGIGRFTGLVNRKVEGLEREYLCVEYADHDQLFVPVYQADRLSRYVGPDSRTPTPTRLGSPEWRNAKSRAQEAVQEVAEDLLELYAKRTVVPGHAFPTDTTWQQELEASFPYVETDDQVRVIGEVKRDMETPRPMDRLICGDVGYGKTEVALRAAFKAVMGGKQVAVLVPTTVLAQQHYNTFRERLAAFPVEVDMLSRFRNPQQQRDILSRLAEGNIDIIIGTHRLIQDDVGVKDLGLLIIDEEQRFGVTHKEKLKELRTEVDVLTLTATPIPRTLYMALTGVRDISTINTPPEERLPITTHVGPYSQRLVRQAILRELERGGQVFFVHNRVQTIQAMRAHLSRLIPEARIAVAHGQMAENTLAERMEKFTNGDVDILLSTSIIESGLDIPNANTLIVDRADTFGLAQLYQLRGRVGRGAQRAYAYFFRHSKRPPTEEGRQRLETIAENTQLGAGYSIAMRDLEIRGAGDILGTRQHGHIAAVGFHLYTRMLSEAVRNLRSQRTLGLPGVPAGEGQPLPIQEAAILEVEPQSALVSVDLPIPVNIPGEYVPDKMMRLRLYRRIAGLSKPAEIEAILGEFNDRFGPAPEDVKNLLYQLEVKLLAEQAGIASVGSENNQIVVRYPPLPENVSSRRFPNLGPAVRIGKNTIWIPSSTGWREHLIEILTRLAEIPFAPTAERS